MKRTRIAAFALASALLALPASAERIEQEWWNVDFSDPPAVSVGGRNYGGVQFAWGELGNLTNNYDYGSTQPYASGLWTMIEGDESFVTNGVTTNFLDGIFVEQNPTNYLELNTQGNDLTWTPTNVEANVTVLVDSMLYLVGSDSAPDVGDFDKDGDVQTAIYLKNELDPDSGETTNSVLCIYSYDDGADAGIWKELDGAPIADNSWHRIQVEVAYVNSRASFHVKVDGQPMYIRGGSSAQPEDQVFSQANSDKAFSTVSSVSFRGTGKIDNFVAKTVETIEVPLQFAAEVWVDDERMPFATGDEDINMSRIETASASESSKPVTFDGFYIDDYEIRGESSYGLSCVELLDPADGSIIATYTFTGDYDDEGYYITDVEVTPSTAPQNRVVISDQDFSFTVDADTAGATQPTNLVAKIYFVSKDAHYADAITVMGENSSTERKVVKPIDFDEGATKPLSWEFADTDGDYVLRTIATTAKVDYENGVVTVSTNLSAALEADTTFVTATYVEGSYAGKTPQLIDNHDGTYTIGSFVAKIGSTPYESLREALDHAVAGDTIVMVADDRVSFTAENTEIVIGKALTIDGGSNTLYGLSNYAPPSNGSADHDIYIFGSDAVTIKNLTLSGFSDSVPTAQQRTNPIWVGKDYTGTLTLDGVTVTNFNRTAFNLGGGTVVVTNCVVGGCYDPEMEGEDCFQSAIEVFNASVTVAETKVTGVGSTMTKEDSQIASCFTMQSDWSTTPWTGGTGSIRILSGSYAGEYIGLAMDLSEGSIFIEGGTFVASAPADDEAFAASVAISGGWFDRPPTNYLASADLAAVDYGTEAPDQRATWTVEVPKVQIDFYVDGGLYAQTNVLAGTTAAGYAPADPTKASTAEFDFTFDWWTNAVGDAYEAADLPDATENAAYYAVFSETTRKYWISWVVDETTTSNEVAYGTVPAYEGTPARPSTESTVYEFDGWTPEIEPVSDEVVYTAKWKESPRPYWVRFWAGTEQEGDKPFAETNAPYGTTGYGPTNTPAKAATAQFTYEFAGWTNAVAGGPTVVTAGLPEVAGEADWTAVFAESTNSYEVIWVVEGSDPKTNKVAYGVVPAYEGTPARESTVGTNFTFAGWSPEVVAVTEDAIYTATWTEELRKYWISWVVDGTTTSNEVDYGTAPSYGPDPEKENYTFLGWSTTEDATVADYAAGVSLPTVEETAKYYAVFEQNVVEPPEVDVGDNLLANDGAPMEFAADGKCTVRFRAPATGVYVLLSSTTVNGTYVADEAASATKTVTDLEDNLVELTEGTAGTTKFFKIGWSAE